MKRKTIMITTPKPAKTADKVVTAQLIGDSILNLNVWDGGFLRLRYGLNLETYEHECLHMDDMSWREELFQSGMGYGYWCGYSSIKEKFHTKEDRELVIRALQITWKINKDSDIFFEIWRKETSYGSRKRILAETRRQDRIRDTMNRIPPIPDGFRKWMYQKISNGQEYAFYDSEKNYVCTGCRKKSRILKTDKGKRAVHNDNAQCPFCKRMLLVKTRSKEVKIKGHAMHLQVCDDALSAARHFDMTIIWDHKKTEVILSESVRIMIFKQNKQFQKTSVDLYYNQFTTGYDSEKYSAWDNKHDPANRTTFCGFLYPGKEISSALESTRYEGWGKLFEEMAADGIQINYNRLMVTGSKEAFIRMIEYLYKGRFFRMARDASEDVSMWSGDYCGSLNPSGKTAREVFRIQDQQKINRIREINGGRDILEWMRWSDQTGKKIPQETLSWLVNEDITIVRVNFILDRMSLTQIMHYVIRQQGEGYKGQKARGILSTWEDYLSMCKKKNKDISDEMIYRPKELKRRHAEIVEEIRKEEMIRRMRADRKQKAEEAKKMREKYPGAEDTLREIRSRYEYKNEEYMVIVPKNLIEIMIEGNALHHCVGSSERYFERIMRKETYICFLRRVSEPKTPFYTLEVEPGGTIRQHRSMYDEEPGIEEIRGFLKEWQQTIKKRLTEEDRRLAGVSRILREKNIEELKAKKNERVLKGLMEDFLEAI